MKAVNTLISSALMGSALMLAASMAPASAHAARWSNQFIEFELPAQWNCSLEASEWICQSADPARKKEAIIVIAAKLKGDQDSLDQYLAYLRQPKSLTVQGRALKSDPKYVKSVSINGHPWADALHLESEIPGFYTRYLATIKTDIAVLLTYSIAKSKYQDYAPDFETLVKTLRVFRKPGAGINGGIRSADGSLLNPPQSAAPVDPFAPIGTGGDSSDKKHKPPEDEGLPLIPVLVGGAAVILVLIRRRKR